MEDINIDDDSHIEKLMEIHKIQKEMRKTELEIVDQIIREREYLASRIRIDPLTGLHNRRILSKVREYGSVVMCDIDNFKSVNDTYGHKVGDEVIKSVAVILLDSIRIGDVAIRYGGDEFMLIFTTDKEDVIRRRMQDVSKKVYDTIRLPDFNVTLSIGIACSTGTEDLDTLKVRADKALYQSKENGKNQITCFGNTNVLEKR